jgi:lysophospholipid acyltransferase (LPLAT)-like uncharacterized protein
VPETASLAPSPGGSARSLRRVLGWILGSLVALWVRTLRVVVEVEPGAADVRRTVYAFFHGQQMLLLGALRGRAVAVMVSHSKDGELQTGVLSRLGLGVVRGSSSRGGARALGRLVRVLRGGEDVAFAVDGPRGPARVAKPGAAFAAEASGAELRPVAAAASHVVVLGGTWDGFEVPLPFARVVVVVGAPVSVGRGEAVAARIEEARLRAERRGEGARARPVGEREAS